MQTNKTISQWFVEFQATNDSSIADRILSPELVAYTPISPPVKGREAYKAFVASFHAAFPDLIVTLEDEFATADRAFVRFTAIGTHRAELMGVAPTDKQLTITETHIFRLHDGKIVEDYVSDNTLDLAQLMGALAPHT